MMLNGYERIFILVKRMKNEQIFKNLIGHQAKVIVFRYLLAPTDICRTNLCFLMAQ